jgi:hypothetical protein
MFELNDETRDAIVTILRERFNLTKESNEDINAVIDEVVTTVKAQFGF